MAEGPRHFRIESLERLRACETAEQAWFAVDNDQFFDLSAYVHAVTGEGLRGYESQEAEGALDGLRRTLDELERVVDVLNAVPEIARLREEGSRYADELTSVAEKALMGDLDGVVEPSLLAVVQREIAAWATGLTDLPGPSNLLVYVPEADRRDSGSAAPTDAAPTKARPSKARPAEPIETPVADGTPDVAVRHPQLRMLSDAPIDDDEFDLLHHGDYADALAFLIDHPATGTPLTIAINAPWGAGKTSLAKLTEKRLRNQPLGAEPAITCWFNAWHHDDANNIGTGLAATVARAVAPERSLLRRIFDPLPTNVLTTSGRRRRWLLRTLVLVPALVIAILSAGVWDVDTGLTSAAVLALITTGVQQFGAIRGTAADIGSLVRSPGRSLSTGSLVEVSTDLAELIHQATQRDPRPGHHRRLVVFIDDVERCQPPRAIEVCEAVSQLLAHEDVVVVLIGDMQTIARSAEIKYKDLRSQDASGDPTARVGATAFGELYLDKIVQFRFDLPADDPDALSAFADALLRADAALSGPEPDGVEPSREPGRLSTWMASLRDRSPLRRWRERRRRRWEAAAAERALDDDGVQAWLASPDRTGRGEHLVEQLLEEFPQLRSHDRTRLEGAATLRVLDGPEHLQRAFEAVRAGVPPFPRDSKRLLNRIRFLLSLGMQRELIGDDLQVEHVGKWALLTERWPGLVIRIANEPDELLALESAEDDDAFEKQLERVAPGYTASPDLREFFRSPPSLAPICRQLVTMRGDDAEIS